MQRYKILWVDDEIDLLKPYILYLEEKNYVVESFNNPFSLIEYLDNNNDYGEIENKIIKILETKIRPAVARDGGDITFKEFKDGKVTVILKGSCSGCPSSTLTLKQGVQNLLCHYIPEVKEVLAV